MTRIARALTVAFALFVAGALAEAPVQDAFAQAGTKQVRAKKQKAQRQVPAARATQQAVPAAQARPPVFEPPSRESSSGGGY